MTTKRLFVFKILILFCPSDFYVVFEVLILGLSKCTVNFYHMVINIF